MNKYVKASALLIGLVTSSAIFAAPTGGYVLVGGGADYLQGSSLKSTTITSTSTSTPPITVNYGIGYQQKSKFHYLGRTAVGYYFNTDPTNVSALGIEAGFNYFGPIRSMVHNTFQIPLFPQNYGVTTSEKTTAWSTDLEGVFSQDLIIPHTALLLKLGVGYEQMQNQITNTTQGISNQFPPSETIKTSGLGVAGGVGLQYNMTKNVGLRFEIDGLKGKRNIGYAQSVIGLVFSF